MINGAQTVIKRCGISIAASAYQCGTINFGACVVCLKNQKLALIGGVKGLRVRLEVVRVQ
jgi:hypothetical protein